MVTVECLRVVLPSPGPLVEVTSVIGSAVALTARRPV